MNVPIKFGTEGWRGIIADDFTFDNVRLCSQGVAELVNSNKLEGNKSVLIGYDTRFGSQSFAEVAAETIARNGIPVYLSNKPAPTPALSFNTKYNNHQAAIIITASHNSYKWNGFKLKLAYGGPANTKIITDLETQIDNLSKKENPFPNKRNSKIEYFNPDETYLPHIKKLVSIDSILNARLSIVIDAMWGVGSGYLSSLCSGNLNKITEIRSKHDPMFPNIEQPEPVEKNLSKLQQEVINTSSEIGLANDGDADRLGVVNKNGAYISSLQIFALLCMHQLEFLGNRAPIVKSITMTNMIDKLGKYYNVPVFSTSVGFKNIAPIMVSKNAMAAGEESGGYAFNNNMPERDGILSGLLLLEMMAVSGKNLSELIELLESKVGTHHYDRLDIKIQNDQKDKLIANLISSPITSIGNKKVLARDTTDGFKYTLDNEGSWLLIRFSGTEPLLRIYAECQNQEDTQNTLNSMAKIMGIHSN
ncbi:MAG: phosphoglucomutase/phosphomannomutase family protein [SAR202 cluster bacterium]|nr:phosphomannomutase [Chloroflexota bacterium]MQG38967.1 phosphoglucomutase/phosphomannomutase family protein [SAR202 cluster bacterium]